MTVLPCGMYGSQAVRVKEAPNRLAQNGFQNGSWKDALVL